jgi:hypothetical protein
MLWFQQFSNILKLSLGHCGENCGYPLPNLPWFLPHGHFASFLFPFFRLLPHAVHTLERHQQVLWSWVQILLRSADVLMAGDHLNLHPVSEISRLLRRSQSSIWHMLYRLGENAEMGKDRFTKYSLASALHARPEKIEEWIARGWLKARLLESG